LHRDTIALKEREKKMTTVKRLKGEVALITGVKLGILAGASATQKKQGSN